MESTLQDAGTPHPAAIGTAKRVREAFGWVIASSWHAVTSVQIYLCFFIVLKLSCSHKENKVLFKRLEEGHTKDDLLITSQVITNTLEDFLCLNLVCKTRSISRT